MNTDIHLTNLGSQRFDNTPILQNLCIRPPQLTHENNSGYWRRVAAENGFRTIARFASACHYIGLRLHPEFRATDKLTSEMKSDQDITLGPKG